MSSMSQSVRGVKVNFLGSVRVRVEYNGRAEQFEYEQGVGALRCMQGMGMPDEEVLVSVPGLMEPRNLSKGLQVLSPRGVCVYDKDAKVGGYTSALEHFMEGVKVGKLRLPKLKEGDSLKFALACLERALDVPGLQTAYVDAGEVVMAAASEKTGWLGALSRSGIDVLDGGKTSKRLRVLLNRYLFQSRFETREFAVQILDNPEPSLLLDGAFCIRESRVREIIEDTDAASSQQKGRARRCRLHSCRVVIPAGTPGCEQGGLLKGNACVVPDHLMPAGVDVVTARVNVKTEIQGCRFWVVMFEPQPGGGEVRTNVQAMCSLPQLFPEDEVREWIDAQVSGVARRIAGNDLLDDYDKIITAQKEAEKRGEDSHCLSIRWNALEFMKTGLTYWHAPSLVRRLYESHTKTICDRVQGKLRVLVPFAVDEQVVSQSFARLCGSEVVAEQGQLRRDRFYGFSVVSDRDWLEMNPSHGGCDMDDHFMLFARLVRGQQKVIVMRNPSSMGEYSVFDAAANEWPGGEWPEVELGNAPMRLSEALREGAVHVVGLPKGKEEYSGGYGLASVLREIEKALSVSLNPGKYVNADMLYSMVFDEQREVLVDTMEKIIDACVQGGSVEAVISVRKEADRLLKEVVESGLPVDRTFWNSRGFEVPEGVEVNLQDGWLTRLTTHAEKRIRKMGAWLGKKAQERHEIPPQLLEHHAVSGKEKFELKKLLKWWRSEAYNLMKDGRRGTKEEWQALQKQLFGAVGVDRVGQFAFVCHAVPTTTGEVQDGCLWNKEFIGHYLKCLQNKTPREMNSVGAEQEVCF